MASSSPNRVPAPAAVLRGGRLGLVAVLAVAAVLVFGAYRKAWVTDDAYITFRAIENLFDGHGLTWNVGERVQVFTHPLWMMAMCGVRAVTGGFFHGAVALNLALTLATALLLALRLARSWPAACVGLGLLAASRAFTDFATSGLENALLHLLLALLVWLDDGSRTRAAVARFSLVASLCLMTRPDALFLIAPAWVLVLLRAGPRRAAAPLLAGLAPLVLWELFALVYYGSLLPNSVLAKLNHGLPAGAMIAQGGHYLANSLRGDPVTLVGIAAAAAAGLATLRGVRFRSLMAGEMASGARPDAPWTWGAGLVLMLLYVVAVGGDFMSGRFLTAPLAVAAAVIVTRPLPAWFARAAGAALLALFLLPWTSPLRDRDYGTEWHAAIDADGIADERSYYTESGSLRAARRAAAAWPDPRSVQNAVRFKREWPADNFVDYLLQLGVLSPEDRWPPAAATDEDGRPLRMVAIRGAVGFLGYHLGPSVHVLDYHALGDPLLARLPATVPDPILRDRIPRLASLPWRIGHFYRRPPVGYVRTLACGRNVIADPDIARYYDVIRSLTRDPVFDRERLATLWKFQFGGYEELRRRAAAASARR